MFNTIKSSQGILIDTLLSMGIDYIAPDNTTLNEKYSVIGTGTGNMKLSYFGVGIIERPLTDPLEISKRRLSPTDGDIYRPIPFLLKPINIQLTAEEKSKYRMIATETYGGVTYNACYLKKFRFVKHSTVRILSSSEGYEYVGEYEPSAASLTPTPENNIELYPENNKFIGTSVSIALDITDAEMVSISEACDIIYPNIDKVISQVGLYTCRDGDEISDTTLHTSVRTEMSVNMGRTLELDIGGYLPIHTIN